MSPKSADKGGYYIYNFILLKNEPQIGRRPIKVDFLLIFSILLGNEPKISRRPIKGDFMFLFIFERQLTNFIKNLLIFFQILIFFSNWSIFLNI